jgi:hypothetical protein
MDESMPMTDDEFDAFVAESVEELERKQDKLQNEFGLGTHADFLFDQATGTLEFKDASGAVRVRADVTPIGSFSERSETWQWAWANESLLPALRERAQECRALETATGFAVFGQAVLKAAPDMPWELAAMAVRQLDALGCYRPPSSGGVLFLAIHEIA